MKIIVNDDINMIIFLNKIYLNQIDFEDKEKLEIYFRKLLKTLKEFYKININGYYEINVYVDNNYGVILELKKEEIEYFSYYEDEVDMQLIVHNTVFLYEIEDYFWIEKELKNKILLYKYNKKIYMVINHNIDDILLGKIIENSNLKYKDNQKIIKEKNLITIYLWYNKAGLEVV